jgi:fructokinase
MTGKAQPSGQVRVGVDLGGTKIAGVVLGPGGAVLAEHRMPAPRHDYGDTVRAVGEMVRTLEEKAATQGSIGIGIPGSVTLGNGLVQNANSTWLNGRPLQRDLEAHLGRPVRLANDANCFALSEAVDGAGAGARAVFGVILGTGCGGGLVLDGAIIDGPRGIGGEWGHNPLPWANADEYPGHTCWCGRANCMETWVSGPGLEADHARLTGERVPAEEIAARAAGGAADARATLQRHAGRLARGLAHVINIFDPDVVVLGGGLSKLTHLYAAIPGLAAPYVFADPAQIIVRPPVWGDAGGVRGAAWLWGGPDASSKACQRPS